MLFVKMSSSMVSVQVLCDVAQRLQNLHAAGFVHGSVQPSNILWLTSVMGWTLTDFDCAAAIGAVSAAPTLLHGTCRLPSGYITTERHLCAGEACHWSGNVHFTPPEVAVAATSADADTDAHINTLEKRGGDGTAGKMGEENASACIADGTRDVWAFGVVAYELLTRTAAFPSSLSAGEVCGVGYFTFD